MGKKQKKKSGNSQPKRKIRISQCMIVKNEEKNIERALSWARDIAFEQIVVDTGSTDKTAEIAEKLGAKVFHFEWIDDFAAAKNFAIDKASGDWIAFLDADEYFSAQDAKELTVLLREIENSPDREDYQGVTCSWVQLDETGNTFAVLKQERVFRNRPEIRYKGRIHERLTMTKYNVEELNLRIMHDGYSKVSFSSADKENRNVTMLRRELEREPDNAEIMIYLADSIKTSMKRADEEEAESLYKKALDSGSYIHPLVKKLAYDFLIPYYINGGRKHEDTVRLCAEAAESYPEYVDFYFYSGLLKNMVKDYEGALHDLNKCKYMMENTAAPLTRFLLGDTKPLNEQIAIAKRHLPAEQTGGRYDKQTSKVRLSQCMIVKNEEANIERALSWARDIAYEQIVVDTGSTDKTVEIAERLGAKIYHFEWINDFAAAKNHAIEQASGNWIAFLDADEYFDDEDAYKLMKLLEEIEESGKDCKLVSCPLLQLDDQNRVFGVYQQDRVFRNDRSIRYKGKIHEVLTVKPDNIKIAANLSIYHTGYANSAFEDTGKLKRNIDILRAELKENREDLMTIGYLADSLSISDEAADRREAGQLYKKIAEKKADAHRDHLKNAYAFLIGELIDNSDLLITDSKLKNEFYELCNNAVEEFSDDINYRYLKAALLINHGDYSIAQNMINELESKSIEEYNNTGKAAVRVKPVLFFCKTAIAGRSVSEISEMASFITLSLKTNRYQAWLLSLYIYTFKQLKVSDADLIDLLNVLYSFNRINDKLFIARAAKDCGTVELAQTVMDMITAQERKKLSGGEK